MAGRRRHRTEWQALLQEQALSGQTVAAFCRERGLAPKALLRWRTKLRTERRHAELPGVVEIVVDRADPAPASDRSPALVLAFGGGCSLAFSTEVPAEYVAELAAGLRKRGAC